MVALVCALTACAVDEQKAKVDLGEQVLTNGVEAVAVSGVLHFESADAFFDGLDAIAGMTPEQLDAWEDEIGFVSQRRLFEQASKQIMEAATTEMQTQLLAEYADVVEGTEDELRPKIRAFGYAAFASRNGLFYVEGVLHKVLPEIVIIAEDGRLETIEHALSGLESSDSRDAWDAIPSSVHGVRIVKYSEGTDWGSHASVSRGCTASRSALVEHKRRKLDFNIWTNVYSCSGCCGNTYEQVRVEWQMRGYKKNWRGRWKAYNTSYEYRDVEFEVSAPDVTGFDGERSVFAYADYSYEYSGRSSRDVSSFKLSTFVGDRVQNATIEVPYFKKVRGRSSSRGVGRNWASICCGYAGGCGF